MQTLQIALNVLSSLLLAPVMIGLLVGFALSLTQLHTLFLEALRRPALRKYLFALENRGVLADAKGTNVPARITKVLELHQKSEKGVERSLARHQLACAKELELSKALIRLGPMLGLMGTLIPMGPALTALASGDLAVMAGNLQIAFATTVIGILVGGCGFVRYLIAKRWHAEEELVLENLGADYGTP